MGIVGKGVGSPMLNCLLPFLFVFFRRTSGCLPFLVSIYRWTSGFPNFLVGFVRLTSGFVNFLLLPLAGFRWDIGSVG